MKSLPLPNFYLSSRFGQFLQSGFTESSGLFTVAEAGNYLIGASIVLDYTLGRAWLLANIVYSIRRHAFWA